MKKKLIIVLLVILLLLIITFFFNKWFIAHNIKVVEYGITDKKLPDDYHGLKIVHFSDILYGKSTNINDVKKTVKKINELNPDIVVFTGDLFTKDIKVNDKEITKIKNELSRINAKIEKFAILGDNDKHFKDKFYTVFKDDFIILDNEIYELYNGSEELIKIIGINDIKKEDESLKEDTSYKIVLLHKPDEIEKLKNNYNLVLSGHSMGGQIKIPFYGSLIKLKGAKTYVSGYYDVNNTKLYVNDGIGSQNVNMRVNNRPKINFYRIYSK